MPTWDTDFIHIKFFPVPCGHCLQNLTSPFSYRRASGKSLHYPRESTTAKLKSEEKKEKAPSHTV
ncbi:hypothetical protein EB354_13975 [Chryseobacterium balustinum]|nr:hypothetical protein EB354_13975 [Chryseobacterium balustinum]